jgi:hypothetical protein
MDRVRLELPTNVAWALARVIVLVVIGFGFRPLRRVGLRLRGLKPTLRGIPRKPFTADDPETKSADVAEADLEPSTF